jgi:hypothetical protein
MPIEGWVVMLGLRSSPVNFRLRKKGGRPRVASDSMPCDTNYTGAGLARQESSQRRR